MDWISVLGMCLLLQAGIISSSPDAARVGTIQDDRINEASGIVASRQHQGVYWTHNDGSDGVLYAISRDGSLLGLARLDVKVRDWEDIAADDAGNIYIADTGNNSGNRRHVFVHRIREPDPKTLSRRRARKLPVDRTWRIDFPDGPANIESLFIWQNSGYVIFKQPAGKPAEIYRFDLCDADKTMMDKVVELPVDQPISAADLSADGSQLAALARGSLWIFQVNGQIASAEKADVTHVRFPSVQAEGCCFGGDEILIVAESREIFAVARPAPTTQSARW